MASYRKRGKTWQYTISYTEKNTGEYKQLSKGGFRTKAEAVNEAQELEVLYKKGIVEDKNITLETYYEKWINLYKKQAITKRSYQKYKDTLSAIKKYFPNHKLSEIKKSDYQQFINHYAEFHAKDSTKRLHYHIKRAVETAIEDKILIGNFTKNIVITGKNQTKAASDKFINYSETQKLIRYLKASLDVKECSHYMILLAFMTGLRYGELSGLTWNDIDFDRKSIDVNKTFNGAYNNDFLPLKTDSSLRTVFVDSKTIAILKDYKEEQVSLFKKFEVKNPLNLVFYHYIYGSITNNAVNKSLKKILNKLEITPLITLHGARHTYGSILLYKGIDIAVVSEILGHKDTTITNEIYRHVIEELREKNKIKIDRVLSDIYK